MINKPKMSLDEILRGYSPFGFQISRKSWDWLDISDLVGTAEPRKVAQSIYTLRRLADRLNARHLQKSQSAELIHGGQLASVGIIFDILRYVVHVYCNDENQGLIGLGLGHINRTRGEPPTQTVPPAFTESFPPWELLRSKITAKQFLGDILEAGPNVYATISEIVLSSVAVANPAFAPFLDIFDTSELKRQVPLDTFTGGLEEFFEKQPPFRPVGLTLFECLLAPILASPNSLEGQLKFIKDNWSSFLPPELLKQLILAIDVLAEEYLLRGLGPGESRVLRFGPGSFGYETEYPEPARFSRDADWMSNVVLIAKTVYVWLDQLSKKYSKDIKHLDDIPDQELDRLSGWGFTGLWLIGIWQRSSASQKIKQIMGNPEAAPSAYSLYDYVIADDLGGETAYQNLRDRCRKRGIRLASDMVPNHMGIYSKWVVEHPDWFLQLDTVPYPAYQFTGVDLSEDKRVCIQIEDGYWQHRDAAVVFKRLDKWTGMVQFIYHGNDGTSMPWNDTAQLNFMVAEAREAVIQTILHVARKFSIIRFDAAMTLAKKHYQRLWFPLPGDGGAIPSRAEHSLTKADFDAAFGEEFWREVVDRVAAEVPDTLLLAEAFWLMEGYFVRTLGMHRVYNSAFMNMLKMEENSKYRQTIKNVLEFSSEVLKRFVNFMSNPDEGTAVDQFGKGDKYYGVAVMMVTMPGLPMFGHGQIEGFTEKYGMEYRKAYWDEGVDQEMVKRHEREVFPLMRQRYLFSGSENFALFDFIVGEGGVDENVFAYTNRAGDQRAIVLYNNAYNTTRGWISLSTAINCGSGEEKHLVRKSLSEALALNSEHGVYYIFRDHPSGSEYLRSGRQLAEDGLFAELYAYQFHVFLDFREVADTDGSWARLADRLDGKSVPSINEAYRESVLDPVLRPFRNSFNSELLKTMSADHKAAQLALQSSLPTFFKAASHYVHSKVDTAAISDAILAEVSCIPLKDRLDELDLHDEETAEYGALVDKGSDLWPVVLAWIIVRHLGQIESGKNTVDSEKLAVGRMDDWMLGKVISAALTELNGDRHAAEADTLLVAVMIGHYQLFEETAEHRIGEALETAFADGKVSEYLMINHYDGVDWINRERLERMVSALLLASTISGLAGGMLTGGGIADHLRIATWIRQSAEKASYQLQETVRLLSGDN